MMKNSHVIASACCVSYSLSLLLPDGLRLVLSVDRPTLFVSTESTNDESLTMKYAIHSQLWSAVAYSLLCALRGSNVAGSGVQADRIAGLFTCVLFSYTVCTNSPQCTCRPSVIPRLHVRLVTRGGGQVR